MKLNYIYNTVGNIEYVVVPFNIWNKVSVYAETIEKTTVSQNSKDFRPSEFRGMLSHYNFNIEQELQNMREQWTINI